MNADIERLQKERKRDTQKLQEYDRKQYDMEKHNQELRECLQSATTRTAIETIDRVKQIETRGNVEVNLRNGDVTIMKPLEFVPRTAKMEPTAEFVDAVTAGRI